MSRSWQDSSRPRDERLSDLLAEMTLEEKVAQLGSAFTGFSFEADPAADQQLVAPFQDAFEETPWDESILDGLGQITRAFGTAPVSAAEGVARLAAMQRDLVDETRLGIPAIAHEECLTGFTTYQATIYPTPLALAATFNPDLVRRIGRRIGDDLRSVGVHQGLAPVLDVVRDYRWGRVEETLGEDPYLVAIMGAAYVRGLESGGVIATLKHFVGYSASRAARNHAPVSMGPRELRDVMLPPFEVAVREGGARSVMNAYTDIDGVPVAADRELLTTLLRDEMGFTGVTVSDYWSISLLSDVHKVAASPAASGALALEAGVDVELPASRCYGAGLVDLVRGGQLDEAVVDRSVRRVLDQKLDLGLLDADYDPLSGVDPAPDLDNPENRAAAQLAAEESVILLANRGILPLTGPLRLAVVGPTAAEARSFLGCYSYPNHLLHRFPELGLGVPVPTLADAVVAEFPTTQVTTTPGCAINGTDTSGIAEAVTVVRRADVALVAVGDLAGMFGGGTSGEGCDAPDLALPGVQAELVRAVLATGTPTVLVCVSGRPYALGEFSDAASAIVQAFMPGQGAGSAIAGVIVRSREPEWSSSRPDSGCGLRTALDLPAVRLRPSGTRCQLDLGTGPLPLRARTLIQQLRDLRPLPQRHYCRHRRPTLRLRHDHEYGSAPGGGRSPALLQRSGGRGGPAGDHASRLRPSRPRRRRTGQGDVRGLRRPLRILRTTWAHRRFGGHRADARPLQQRHRPPGATRGDGHDSQGRQRAHPDDSRHRRTVGTCRRDGAPCRSSRSTSP